MAEGGRGRGLYLSGMVMGWYELAAFAIAEAGRCAGESDEEGNHEDQQAAISLLSHCYLLTQQQPDSQPYPEAYSPRSEPRNQASLVQAP